MEWHQRCSDILTSQANCRAVYTEYGYRFFLFFERRGGPSDETIPRLVGAEGKDYAECLGSLFRAFTEAGVVRPRLVWANDERWASARRSGDAVHAPSAEPTPTA